MAEVIRRLYHFAFSTKAVLFASRLLGAFLGLATQLILTRMVPPEELGLFFFATSIATVLGVIAALGYPGFATRILARRQVGPRGFQTYLHFASKEISVIAIGIALISLAPILVFGSEPAIAAAFFAVPALALGRMFAVGNNLCRRPLRAYLPELIARPFLFGGAIALLYLYGKTLSPTLLAVVFSATCWVSLMLLYLPLAQELKSNVKTKKPQRQIWRLSAIPLVFVAIATSIYGDLAISSAGFFLPASDVAVFSISLKIALLIGFATQVSQQTTLPDMIESYRNRDLRTFLGAWRSAVTFPISISLLALFATVTFGQEMLSLFGTEYQKGHFALVIFVGAQTLRAIFGPTVQLAVFTGETRRLMLVFILPLLLMLVAFAATKTNLNIAAAYVSFPLVAWPATLLWLLIGKLPTNGLQSMHATTKA